MTGITRRRMLSYGLVAAAGAGAYVVVTGRHNSLNILRRLISPEEHERHRKQKETEAIENKNRELATSSKDPKVLSKLGLSDDIPTKINLAANPYTPAETQLVLSNDKSRGVLLALASNENTTGEALDSASKSEYNIYDDVMQAIVLHSNVKPETLDHIAMMHTEISAHNSEIIFMTNSATYQTYKIKVDIAKRDDVNLDPKTLDYLGRIRSFGPELREAVASNRRTPKTRLLKFLDDPQENWRVRAAVKANLENQKTPPGQGIM